MGSTRIQQAPTTLPAPRLLRPVHKLLMKLRWLEAQMWTIARKSGPDIPPDIAKKPPMRCC